MKHFPSFVCLFFIKVYRVFLSAHFGGACRFYPSCSCYAEQVFLDQPFFKAVLLVLKRLIKCHFFGPFGLDLYQPGLKTADLKTVPRRKGRKTTKNPYSTDKAPLFSCKDRKEIF